MIYCFGDSWGAGAELNINEDFDFVECDIRYYDEVKKGLVDVDFVIHTAIIQIPVINEKKLYGYEVNVKGTQNICEIVNNNSKIKGLLITGTWHTIGERNLYGLIDEKFGYRPDYVDERARLYAISKIIQEGILRYYDELSNKVFGIIRMGTVLGFNMPEKTAANIFIKQGLSGKPITPFKHTMYRPMLYVDINDICIAFTNYVDKVLSGNKPMNGNSLDHIVNVYYSTPTTILDLAHIVKDSIILKTNGSITPTVTVIDKGLPLVFQENCIDQIDIDIHKSKTLLNLEFLTGTQDSINKIIEHHLTKR